MQWKGFLTKEIADGSGPFRETERSGWKAEAGIGVGKNKPTSGVLWGSSCSSDRKRTATVHFLTSMGKTLRLDLLHSARCSLFQATHTHQLMQPTLRVSSYRPKLSRSFQGKVPRTRAAAGMRDDGTEPRTRPVATGKEKRPFDCLPLWQPLLTFGHCQTSQTRSHEKSWKIKPN